MKISFLYNYEAIALLIGGLIPILIAASISYAKREVKRNNEKERLKKIQEERPEEVGDIEEKLNNTIGYESLSFTKEIVNLGFQPLFLVLIFSFLNREISLYDVVVFAVLFVFMISHEFWASDRFSHKTVYKLSILILWGIIYIYICATLPSK